jgi:hypothetical protein
MTQKKTKNRKLWDSFGDQDQQMKEEVQVNHKDAKTQKFL